MTAEILLRVICLKFSACFIKWGVFIPVFTKALVDTPNQCMQKSLYFIYERYVATDRIFSLGWRSGPKGNHSVEDWNGVCVRAPLESLWDSSNLGLGWRAVISSCEEYLDHTSKGRETQDCRGAAIVGVQRFFLEEYQSYFSWY